MDFLQPEGWPRPPGFSNGTAATGRHVFIAGQIGIDQTSRTLADGFAAQTEQALRNVVAVLAEAGGRPEHLARLTWFVTDVDAWRAAGRDLGPVWKEVIGRHFPAITLVEVSRLIDDEALLEIDAHAVIPE